MKRKREEEEDQRQHPERNLGSRSLTNARRGGLGGLPLLVPLLLVLHLLEPEEFLPVTLIKLGDNVGNGVLNLGDDNVLNGVHTAVGQLDHLIQNQKGGLQVMFSGRGLKGMPRMKEKRRKKKNGKWKQ